MRGRREGGGRRVRERDDTALRRALPRVTCPVLGVRVRRRRQRPGREGRGERSGARPAREACPRPCAVNAHAGPPASWEAIQVGGSGGETGRDGGEGESAARARAVAVPRPTRPTQRLRACANLLRGCGHQGGSVGGGEGGWSEGGRRAQVWMRCFACKTPPGARLPGGSARELEAQAPSARARATSGSPRRTPTPLILPRPPISRSCGAWGRAPASCACPLPASA